MKNQKNQAPITWQAAEFKHYEKNAGWYVTLIAMAILIVAFFALQGDIFAAVTTGILALIVIFFSRVKPQDVDIELSHRGIKFGTVFYPYKQIKHFWVVHNEHHKTVNFHTTTYVNNILILELGDQTPDEIREYLLQHLPEHEETEATTAQKIMHRLKF
jgi:hypothetical protein